YVVEAESTTPATTCLPRGPAWGGATTRECLEAVTDAGSGPWPSGVDATLRASHVGDSVTMHWSGARTLLATEHFHLKKAATRPTAPFLRMTPEGTLARSFTETDTSAALQFFD